MMRLCFPGVPYQDQRQDGYLQLPNQSQVWFGGLDDKERVEKILGQEYATILFNECSQIHYSSVLVVLSRLAQNVEGLRLRAYYDLNPGAQTHWTNQIWGQHKDPMTGQPLDPADYARMFMNPDDNRVNLPEQYFKILDALPERQRKRFRDGEYVSDLPGALWSLDTLERCRVDAAPQMDRIVIGVDPSGTRGGDGRDAVGIVAVGRGVDGLLYVLDDWTCSLGPAGWAARVVELYDKLQADVVVAEANYGGAMVEATIRTVRPSIPYREVTASRGKHIRAEPIAALYEKDQVRHVGRFPELEEQMTAMTTHGYQGTGSPDRLDAAVWALTELSPANAIVTGLPLIISDRDLGGRFTW